MLHFIQIMSKNNDIFVRLAVGVKTTSTFEVLYRDTEDWHGIPTVPFSKGGILTYFDHHFFCGVQGLLHNIPYYQLLFFFFVIWYILIYYMMLYIYIYIIYNILHHKNLLLLVLFPMEPSKFRLDTRSEEPTYTTWKIRPKGEIKRTIDYIFHSSSLLAAIQAGLKWRGAQNHRFFWRKQNETDHMITDYIYDSPARFWDESTLYFQKPFGQVFFGAGEGKTQEIVSRIVIITGEPLCGQRSYALMARGERMSSKIQLSAASKAKSTVMAVLSFKIFCPVQSQQQVKIVKFHHRNLIYIPWIYHQYP